jgi:TonB family protein
MSQYFSTGLNLFGTVQKERDVLSFQTLLGFSYKNTVMIAPALLYRPNARWLISVAFACAALLHLAAIALARNEPQTPLFSQPTDSGVDVIIDPTSEATPVELTEQSPSEPPPVINEDEVFPEESATPPPVRSKSLKPMSRLVRLAAAGGTSAASFGLVKALAVYAPRPAYPYEARRQHTTGSGVVSLTIDASTGAVTDARMAQSTGSAILDNSAVSALRRWRFKSGGITRVRVPITYTLSGAAF